MHACDDAWARKQGGPQRRWTACGVCGAARPPQGPCLPLPPFRPWAPASFAPRAGTVLTQFPAIAPTHPHPHLHPSPPHTTPTRPSPTQPPSSPPAAIFYALTFPVQRPQLFVLSWPNFPQLQVRIMGRCSCAALCAAACSRRSSMLTLPPWPIASSNAVPAFGWFSCPVRPSARPTSACAAAPR